MEKLRSDADWRIADSGLKCADVDLGAAGVNSRARGVDLPRLNAVLSAPVADCARLVAD